MANRKNSAVSRDCEIGIRCIFAKKILVSACLEKLYHSCSREVVCTQCLVVPSKKAFRQMAASLTSAQSTSFHVRNEALGTSTRPRGFRLGEATG